ncbi:MAG TPA: sugar ABC transporter permease [Terriglobia bacterium]|nr:sugar ABC transporter permease [Terriglobia bacterium]
MQRFFRTLGVDPRFSSMVLALIVIWLVLQLLTDGIFLTPRNLYNLSIQTCVTAIMACGMVFVIVARQIDLSVGSLLAFTGMVTAYVQVHIFGNDSQIGWIVSIIAGVALGVAVGIFQGGWVTLAGIPAFVVTLAGYLMYRGAAFLVTDGQTISPLNPTYERLGGGIGGSIGPTASTILGIIAAIWVIFNAQNTRRQRKRYGATQTPVWADVLKIVISIAAIAAFVATMNSYPDPAHRDAAGNPIATGIGIPVLILIAIVILLTFIATRTRFGRYVFAYGGNPEAALLSGINTRRLLISIFALMGSLSAVAAVVTTARLNSGANSIGTLQELYVIAATVIGGTSLAGGLGSIPGAVIGALIISSLDNGMVLLDVPSAQRQIFIGLILIGAVWFDTVYNKRMGR